MLAIGTFFVVNTVIVAAVIALVQRTKVLRYLVRDLFNSVATGGLLLGLAPVVVLAADFFLPAIALLFLPLYAVHRGGRDAIAKQHQALHDALTGLPNRELFRDRIDQAVNASRRSGDTAVVMIMDLDHFKEINDTLGHHMGDLLLQEVSRRLRLALRESDTVARLGGDEFGVLLPRVETAGDGAAVAQNLLVHLREPFVLEGMRLEIDASIGLALHPLHGEDNETLQQRADIAMYSAKQSGRGFAIFEPELDRHSPRRLALAGGLRSGDQRGPDPALLPAQGRPAHGPDHGRRGARALGSPGVRHRRPERVRADRRADRPDHAADLVRARRRDPPGARVEGRRPGALDRRQPLRPLVPGHAARGRDPAPARPSGTSRPSCSSSRSPRAC